ncbi:endonuclease V [Biomphalaria glabrata]|nr:endonuclease V [Biomphalaria glabrata]
MNDFCCGCGILLPIGDVNNETMCKVCKREASLRQLNNKSQTCDCEYCERSDNYKLLPSKETKFLSQPVHLQFSPTQNHNELDFRISQIHFVVKNESLICGGNEFTTSNQVVQEQSSDILIGLNSNELEEKKAVDSFISEEIKQKWESEQLFYKEQLIQKDTSAIAALISGHRRKADGSRYYVGGVDISFIVGNSVDACACLCVVRMPDLEVVLSLGLLLQILNCLYCQNAVKRCCRKLVPLVGSSSAIWRSVSKSLVK